jgi:hypothetical protein
MNRKLLVSALGLPVVAAIVLAGGSPASASGGGGQMSMGNCSASADWYLHVSKDDGQLEVLYKVYSNRRGQTWAVSIKDNGNEVFAGDKVTKRPSGSFRVHEWTNDLAGVDVFDAIATNVASGATCTGKLILDK